VGSHLSKQRVRLQLPCGPGCGQFREGPYGAFQPIQFIGGAAGFGEVRELSRRQDVRPGDCSPEASARCFQASRLPLVGHTDIISF
jgi:hypothetical protein